MLHIFLLRGKAISSKTSYFIIDHKVLYINQYLLLKPWLLKLLSHIGKSGFLLRSSNVISINAEKTVTTSQRLL